MDDSVSVPWQIISVKETDSVQFTVLFRYPAGTVSSHPFTAILRGHILSVRSSQIRYVVRGTKGTFLKSGVDIQEDQLRAMPSFDGIFQEGYGIEPKDIWGTLETLQEDGSVKISECVQLFASAISVTKFDLGGLHRNQDAISTFSRILRQRYGTVRSRRLNGKNRRL